jgi:hypothetical protein
MQGVREDERPAKLGDEIHSDHWGPSSVTTINWKEYFVSFTDDHIWYTIIYLQSKKSETFKSYKEFEAWLKTQHGIQIQKLQSDRGSEYLSREFETHLWKPGTVCQLTVHDTPETCQTYMYRVPEFGCMTTSSDHLESFSTGSCLYNSLHFTRLIWIFSNS